ncbi:2447_t:CDS:2, partial [Dentiscutata heterogama]
NFILKKVEQHNLVKKFNNILLGTIYDIMLNIRETKVRYAAHNLDNDMKKYEFASFNINNYSIKVIKLSQKYQARLVIIPCKNINNCLVPDLDFTSMYLTTIITMNISLETEVLTTSSDLSLNTIFDNNQIIMKFKPYYDQEEKMVLMLLMYKKLLEEHAKAKRLIKEYKNNPVKLAYFLSKSNALK